MRLVDATTGATYTPTGTITVCPVGVEQPEQDLIQLCDVAADGTATPFIRDYRRDELGAITGHSDYTLDGAAYTPTGTVGLCSDCRQVVTTELCDPANVPPAVETYAAHAEHDPATAALMQAVFPAGGVDGIVDATTFYGGGNTTIPQTAPNGFNGPQVGKIIAGKVVPDDTVLCGNPSQVRIRIVAPITNQGPGGGVAQDSVGRIYVNGSQVSFARATDGVTVSQSVGGATPVGVTRTHLGEVVVSAADYLAGLVTFAVFAETTQQNSSKAWLAQNFALTVESASPVLCTGPGGVTTFLRHTVLDCTTGQVVTTFDTTEDGQPYTPTGVEGPCTQVPEELPEPCQSCETLLLCDDGADDPDTLSGTASSGTLTNGVTWQARGNSAAMTPSDSNAEGAWWGLGSFPCDTAADGTVTEFLRHYVYDGRSDALDSFRDTSLDGSTPHVLSAGGTVGQCQPAACEFTPVCVRPSGRVEFLSNPAGDTSGVDADWTWGQSLAGPWFPTYRVGVFPGWTTIDPGTAEGTAHWIAPHPDSQLANTGQPGEGPTITPGTPDWYGRASFQLPAFADPATIRISATALNADQLAVEWRLNGGAWQPVNRSHAQPPYTLAPTVVPGAQAGVNEVVVHVQETVFPTGAAGILLHVIAEFDVDASAYLQWTQVVCTDGAVYFLDDLGVRQDTLPDGWTTVPCSEPCGDTELAQLCDLVYSPQPPVPVPPGSFTLSGHVGVTGGTLVFSGGNLTPDGVAQRAVTGLISGAAYELLFDAGWNGGGTPPTNDAVYRVEVLDGATVLATSTRNLSNGSSAAGPVLAQPPLTFLAPATGIVAVRFTDLTTGGGLGRDLVIRPNTLQTEDLQVTTTPFLRTYTYDCTGLLLTTTDTELDGSTAYTLQGEAGICSGTSGATVAPDTCAKAVVERCGCDDTDSDGLGDVTYTELWAVDLCNGEDPVLLGTFLDGGLTQPYTPVAPVECTAAEALPGPLSTGVRAVTGTAAVNLASAFPGVQSVSLTVLAGTVNVTMSDGASVPIPAGVTMTWSVAKDSDIGLAAAAFAGATAASQYLLNWTYR
ncbi:hypothetical protein [Streptomyces sp. NBC_01483]|uniref:hypothetical protein n=1 Tax=Streptomyces sp. NBC_01483 TaxID=2903883 RepID=UPI002E335B81|nr:hypothetical protein [Streptomyces sp. NBC_01483]